MTVSGEWVRSGCDDGSGEEERPYTDVAVVFLQADQSLELARTDASGDRFTATVDVTVPDTAAAGPAAFALAPDDGPCPPAVAVLIEAPGPTAELLTGSGAECGNWPAAADAQSELTPLVD
ncbi:hypothetical protein [uncultured Modestobacter sp.]|uniref:hypothetical protein n=1 Tax=uncultured Modestobacter sp. TaxID=380048 RepID=UPI0026375C5B|nr:hypothetical protein [uncultured Modestobacter sp.]